MTLTKISLLYLLTVPVMALIDFLWLGFFAKNFYQSKLKNFLAPDINWQAAIIFYLLFTIGVILFAVLPGLDKKSLLHAMVYGALFGFFTYATYDLTNLATLKDWPIAVVIVDIMWGIFVTGLTATISALIGLWLIK